MSSVEHMKRLGSSHPQILARYLGATKDGSIILEHADRSNRTGADQIPLCIGSFAGGGTPRRGMQYMHDKGIVQADVGYHHNMILTCSEVLIMNWFSYRRLITIVSKQTDVFAYGCAIDEIMTGRTSMSRT